MLLLFYVFVPATFVQAANIGSLSFDFNTDTKIGFNIKLEDNFFVVGNDPYEITWGINLVRPIQKHRLSTTNPVYSNLTPNTRYYFHVRVKAQRNGFWAIARWRKVGIISISTEHRTLKCDQPVSWFDGSLLNASFDTGNCYVTAVPQGGTPFIYKNKYYIKSQPSSNCPRGAWDNANCLIMNKPASGFIWNNGFYAKAGPGNTCPSGSSFDSANCFYFKAPWGTKAFEYNGNFYTTALPTCPDGKFDSANCYLGTPPSNTSAFIHDNKFYYSE